VTTPNTFPPVYIVLCVPVTVILTLHDAMKAVLKERGKKI